MWWTTIMMYANAIFAIALYVSVFILVLYLIKLVKVLTRRFSPEEKERES